MDSAHERPCLYFVLFDKALHNTVKDIIFGGSQKFGIYSESNITFTIADVAWEA